MKTNKKSKILSALLSLVMLVSMLPSAAFADGAETVKVNITAQADGAFLCAPQICMTVSSDTAEDYGYTDSIDGVSALDALVAVHKTIYGEAFTADTAEDYLTMGSLGATMTFGIEDRFSGFAVNGAYPNDGTESPYGGYNGTTVATQKIENGDSVDFFIYAEDWSDMLTWFNCKGVLMTELAGKPGDEKELTLKSISYGMAGYLYPNALAANAAGTAATDAQLAFVSLETGALTDVGGATDFSGKTDFKIPDEAGTYYLTAYAKSGNPLIMPIIKVVSDPNVKEDKCALMALDVWTIDTNGNHPVLKPAFDKDITDYTIDTLEYPENDFLSVFFNINVKATTETEGSVVTVNCSDASAGPTVSADSPLSFTLTSTTGALKPGKNNKLTITVAESAEENAKKRTYTVTMPMKPKTNTAPVAVKNADTAVVAAGDNYKVNLADIFSDPNEIDKITYSVSVNGGASVSAAENYVFTPKNVGEYSLVFTANDGTADSANSYTVTLEAVESYETAYSPDEVYSYLPAPGQFVNRDEYRVPEKTLTGKGTDIVTLGSFGGSVVYKYNTPIKNGADNPYGIDFIVMGNCYATVGETSESGAEPGAVMVSEDGNVWYELAGSEYYTADACKDTTVTYTNPDMAFTEAKPVEWSIVGKENGILPINAYNTQPYYPNPANYDTYNVGEGRNDSYSAESLSVAGTMVDWGFYPFGYADSHARNAEKKNSAVNPYALNHKSEYNGDGFDISWAVDSQGNPVQLDEISYIKIYNPVLLADDVMGEKSPEISAVLRAKPSDNEVGKSGALTSLKVNGNEITLSDNVYTYTADAEGAGSFVAEAQAENTDANIYISNLRVVSGTESAPFAATDKLRIIVQEGIKEPLIYIINFTNTPNKESNADLLSLSLTPGDVKKAPSSGSVSEFSVDSTVAAVRFAPVFANKNATAQLSGGALEEPISLENAKVSDSVAVGYGRNEFTINITSEDGQISKAYTVVVQREATGSSSSPETITVSFSLISDSKRSNAAWIPQKAISIPKNSTVKYLTEMMLNNAGLDYTTNGVYISEINSLGELDNGPNSGWLYRVNGSISDVSYADKKLSDGDIVKWFYTDDYTKESGYEGMWSGGTGGSGTTSGKNDSKNDKEDNKLPTVGKNETQESKLSFTDVLKHWAYKAIKYVYDNAIMQGVSETEFVPEDNMTRAMLMAVIYRLEKAENTELISKFKDIAEDSWYYDAVCWAADAAIAAGMTETEFAPNENITREQVAVILYRYAKMKGYNIEKSAELDKFADKGDISDWAYEAIAWANGIGLINGVSEDTLAPKGLATRAQLAVMLMQFIQYTGM